MLENERLDKLDHAVAFGIPAEKICKTKEEFDYYELHREIADITNRFGLTAMPPKEFPPA
jgi:hypothetical protein